MNVDLIDMNKFIGDDDDEEEENKTTFEASMTKLSDGSEGANSTQGVMTTDFLEDEEIGFRDHSEAKVLTPIVNPYNQEEKP